MTVVANGSSRLDVAAIDALYRTERPRLVRIASKIAPSRDAGEDAVQETFARMLADPDAAQRKGIEPGRFAAAGVKYRALDESSHRGKQTPAGDAIDRLADTAEPDCEGDALTRCMGDPQTAAQVEAALGALPEGDRKAVRMHFLEGLPVSVVAQRLGVSNSTIYSRINRSMARLGELGAHLGADEPAADPAVARQPTVEELAATLAKEVGECRIGVDSAEVVLRRAYGSCPRNHAMAAKNLHNSRLPDDAPAAVVQRQSPDEMPQSLRARLDEANALLARVAEGRLVTYADVAEILHEHGRGRATKLVSAAVRLHNEPLPESAPRYLDRPDKRLTSKPPAEHKPSSAAAVRKRKPMILHAAAFLRETYGATPPADLPRVSELARRHDWDPATASYARSAYIEGLDQDLPTPAAKADASGDNTPDPTVSEAWLSWADAEVTCMFVNTDESTTRHPVTFRAMPGAQREVTGLLIDRGYRPDGPWTDTAGHDESMRRFTPPQVG